MPPSPVSAPLAFMSDSGETRIAASMPGTMMMNGMNIFGNEPMMGARLAEFMSLDAIARCTSTKFVVQ